MADVKGPVAGLRVMALERHQAGPRPRALSPCRVRCQNQTSHP